MTGLHLSHYAIESELGRGGMGVVFLATDTKLNRKVALKVLPASALASPDDRARFQREAQSAAQLNHPNVCHVYQVDEAVPKAPDGGAVEGHMESRLFIAMEYIEGETLHDYVKRGPMKLQEAVNIAGQVAEALKEAHGKDIVHRDIKSANIMLTEGGVAKVLDFGLAKTNQSTMLTRMGSTLGTVAYMSPEQARGQEVDGRSDLYSLGIVLYEMLAGRLPFAGDYEQAVLYGILNEDPEPLTGLRTGVPMDLERIVFKLLAKDARHRYQTAADLIADLETADLSDRVLTRSTMRAAPQEARRPPAWVWGLGGVLLGSGLALLGPGAADPSDVAPIHVSLPLPDSISYTNPVWSSDGRRLMFTGKVSPSANTHVAEYDFAAGELTRLTPDDGSAAGIYGANSQQRYLVRPSGGLVSYSESGGSVTVLERGFGRGAVWIDEGTLGYGRGFSGFATVEVGFPETDSLRFEVRWGTGTPVMPPNSDVVFYSRHYDDRGKNGGAAFDLASGTMLQALSLPDDRIPLAVVAGKYLLTRGTARGPVGAIRISLGERRYLGGESLFFWAGEVGVSPQGHVVYTQPLERGPAPYGEPVYRLDRNGGAIRIAGPAEIGETLYNTFSFSPDGSRFVIDTVSGLTIVSVAAESNRTLTAGRGLFGSAPFWSADGFIYYAPRADSARTIRRVRPDGTDDRLLVESDASLHGPSTSEDGSILVYARRSPETDWDIVVQDGNGAAKPVFVANGPQVEPEVSPNGRWISFRSGTNIVVVSRDGSEQMTVAAEARIPHWSREGNALYFLRDGPPRIVSRAFNPGGVMPLEERFDPEAIVRSVSAQHLHYAPIEGGDLAISLPGWLEEESAGPWRVVFNWASTLDARFE